MTTDRTVSDDAVEAAMLPCPKCGGPAKMISTMGEWSKDGYGPEGSRVVCADLACPTSGRAFHGDNQDAEAIAAWNLRSAYQPEVALPRYRHKKRGTEYVLIGFGRMQSGNWIGDVMVNGEYTRKTVDMREVAIYRSATDPNEIWVRPREEFEDGRFEALAYPEHLIWRP